MNRSRIREKALRLAVRRGRILNVQAVWDEQEAAGQEPCYGAADNGCPYLGCCFRKSCLLLSGEPLTIPVDRLVRQRLAS